MRRRTALALPRWVQASVMLCALLTFANFVRLTEPVRLANVDDVANDKLVRTGLLVSASIQAAEIQGRFYLATPCHLWPYQLYAVQSSWLFSALRAALLFAQIGLLGWLCGRLSENAALGWLVILFAAAALHLPTTFFAALSYPTMGIGFSSLLGGLHCHLNYLRRGASGAALGAGLLVLHACLYLEVYVVFLPVFFALSWREGRTSVAAVARSVVAPVTAVAAYLFAYALFTRAHPSIYPGTNWSFDFSAAATTLLRQTAGAVPGYELLAHRTLPTGEGAWLKSAAELKETLAAMPAWGWALAVAQAATVWILTPFVIRGRPITGSAVATAFLCVLAPNLPLSLSARYQVWAYHREFPYIYSFYAYCALAAACILAGQRFVTSARWSDAARTRWAAILSLAAGCGFFSAGASNSHVASQLHRWYNAAGR